MKQNFLAIVVVLVACASLGSALKCYVCSDFDGIASKYECSDPFGKRGEMKECRQGEVCLKQVTPEINVGSTVIKPMVNRNCGGKELCKSPAQEVLAYCEMCTTDLCNSSITTLPTFTIIALLVLKCLFV